MILGADPGLKGAIVILDGDTPIIHDMPLNSDKSEVDAHALYQLLAPFAGQLEVAVVEQVTSRPRQKGVFNFGVSTGKLVAVIEALGIPLKRVSPAKWKVQLGLRGLEKQASIELAKRLVPAAAPKLSRKKDDGRAEALLIAMHHKLYN
jgi:crossover junction endodeoxyribonuclease RuvC